MGSDAQFGKDACIGCKHGACMANDKAMQLDSHPLFYEAELEGLETHCTALGLTRLMMFGSLEVEEQKKTIHFLSGTVTPAGRSMAAALIHLQAPLKSSTDPQASPLAPLLRAQQGVCRYGGSAVLISSKPSCRPFIICAVNRGQHSPARIVLARCYSLQRLGDRHRVTTTRSSGHVPAEDQHIRCFQSFQND